MAARPLVLVVPPPTSPSPPLSLSSGVAAFKPKRRHSEMVGHVRVIQRYQRAKWSQKMINQHFEAYPIFQPISPDSFRDIFRMKGRISIGDPQYQNDDDMQAAEVNAYLWSKKLKKQPKLRRRYPLDYCNSAARLIQRQWRSRRHPESLPPAPPSPANRAAVVYATTPKKKMSVIKASTLAIQAHARGRGARALADELRAAQSETEQQSDAQPRVAGLSPLVSAEDLGSSLPVDVGETKSNVGDAGCDAAPSAANVEPPSNSKESVQASSTPIAGKEVNATPPSADVEMPSGPGAGEEVCASSPAPDDKEAPSNAAAGEEMRAPSSPPPHVEVASVAVAGEEVVCNNSFSNAAEEPTSTGEQLCEASAPAASSAAPSDPVVEQDEGAPSASLDVEKPCDEVAGEEVYSPPSSDVVALSDPAEGEEVCAPSPAPDAEEVPSDAVVGDEACYPSPPPDVEVASVAVAGEEVVCNNSFSNAAEEPTSTGEQLCEASAPAASSAAPSDPVVEQDEGAPSASLDVEKPCNEVAGEELYSPPPAADVVEVPSVPAAGEGVCAPSSAPVDKKALSDATGGDKVSPPLPDVEVASGTVAGEEVVCNDSTCNGAEKPAFTGEQLCEASAPAASRAAPSDPVAGQDEGAPDEGAPSAFPPDVETPFSEVAVEEVHAPPHSVDLVAPADPAAGEEACAPSPAPDNKEALSVAAVGDEACYPSPPPDVEVASGAVRGEEVVINDSHFIAAEHRASPGEQLCEASAPAASSAAPSAAVAEQDEGAPSASSPDVEKPCNEVAGKEVYSPPPAADVVEVPSVPAAGEGVCAPSSAPVDKEALSDATGGDKVSPLPPDLGVASGAAVGGEVVCNDSTCNGAEKPTSTGEQLCEASTPAASSASAPSDPVAEQDEGAPSASPPDVEKLRRPDEACAPSPPPDEQTLELKEEVLCAPSPPLDDGTLSPGEKEMRAPCAPTGNEEVASKSIGGEEFYPSAVSAEAPSKSIMHEEAPESSQFLQPKVKEASSHRNAQAVSSPAVKQESKLPELPPHRKEQIVNLEARQLEAELAFLDVASEDTGDAEAMELREKLLALIKSEDDGLADARVKAFLQERLGESKEACRVDFDNFVQMYNDLIDITRAAE